MAINAPPDDVQKLEVRIKGRVEFGQEMMLESEDPFAAEQEFDTREFVNDEDIPWTEKQSAATPHLDVDRRLLEHKLKACQRRLSIADDGLSLQYGILGAPGSGKTHLMMHLRRCLGTAGPPSIGQRRALCRSGRLASPWLELSGNGLLWYP